jgi:steroid delta-isomerase-like uncharacterized protein
MHMFASLSTRCDGVGRSSGVAVRWPRALIGALILAGSLTGPAAAETIHDRKAVARRVFDEVFTHGEFDVAYELYAPDFVNHASARDVGLAEDQQAAREWRAAVPDLRMTVDMMVAEGELVTVLWTADGTHTGTGNGLPATGRPVRARGVTIWRIADGRIREEWSVFDQARVMVQLGLLVPASPANTAD